MTAITTRPTKSNLTASANLGLSFLYSLAQISLGLLIHPYQTMQLVAGSSGRIFVWMSLLPSIFLALITLTWRLVLGPILTQLAVCQGDLAWGCQFSFFIGNWLTLFMIFWQAMLIYLLFRFRASD